MFIFNTLTLVSFDFYLGWCQKVVSNSLWPAHLLTNTVAKLQIIIHINKNCPNNFNWDSSLGQSYWDMWLGHHDFSSLSTFDLLMPVISAISRTDFPVALSDLTLAICIIFSCAFGFFRWSASSPNP